METTVKATDPDTADSRDGGKLVMNSQILRLVFVFSSYYHWHCVGYFTMIWRLFTEITSVKLPGSEYEPFC